MKFFLKAFFKIAAILIDGIKTAPLKLKLKLIWNIGRNVKFEGGLFVHSYGGDVSIGDDSLVGKNVRIGASKGGSISIGRNVSINTGTYIVACGNICIGDDCRIGEYVSIRDNDHAWADPAIPIRLQGFTVRDVIIGSDVWIGRGAVISKGVSVGNGVVIGANSVVTRDVPAMAVVVGAPAKIIKWRNGG